MDSLTFCAGGGALAEDGLADALASSLAEGYPGVAMPPVWCVGRYAGLRVNGFACAERVGGVVIQPAGVVLGLKAWGDAFEGVFRGGAFVDGVLGDGVLGEGVPWVLFDAEKIARMMLRQSGLALEILVGSGLDARGLVRAAITREIVLYYRDVTRLGVARLLDVGRSGAGVGADGVWVQALFRNLLTGCVLGQEGHVSLHLDRLLEADVAGGLGEVLGEVLGGVAAGMRMGEDVRALGAQAVRLHGLLAVEHARILPERPSDYEGLDRWLVAERLAAQELVGRRSGQ